MCRLRSLGRPLDQAVAATAGVEPLSKEAELLLRTLYRFEHVCFDAVNESAPQHVAQYLIDLASKFNGFYANNKIMGETVDSRLVELCEKTFTVLEKGLWILGIRTVEKM